MKDNVKNSPEPVCLGLSLAQLQLKIPTGFCQVF